MANLGPRSAHPAPTTVLYEQAREVDAALRRSDAAERAMPRVLHHGDGGRTVRQFFAVTGGHALCGVRTVANCGLPDGVHRGWVTYDGDGCPTAVALNAKTPESVDSENSETRVTT